MSEPVDIRIVGTTRAQLVYLAGVSLGVAVLVVIVRRRTLVPLAATRTARALRRFAQRIEDAGLDVARNAKES